MTGRGYADPGYAASLSEFGTPLALGQSGGWLLQREIEGERGRDLMGPYPLFACTDWSSLEDDITALEGDFVSVVVVSDPLADVSDELLRRSFPDRVVPFKEHLVRDLSEPAELPSHHRRHLRRASAAVSAEICGDPIRYLDDWTRLYEELSERHGISGIRAFSRESFRLQLALPDMLVVRAAVGGETVGMTLWLEDGAKAYYHLGAYSSVGYDVSASYALFALALEHFEAQGVRWVDFGAGAGAARANDGLVRFKSGWANAERVAHLCGRVLHRAEYERLSERSGAPEWFPAYRAGDRDLAGES